MALEKLKFAITTGKRVLPDNDRKPLKTIYKDLRWIKDNSSFKNKSVQHYFECLMYKKDTGNIEHYLPKLVYIDFKKKTRHYSIKRRNLGIVGNKREFKNLAQEKGIPTAVDLGSIKNNILTIPSQKEYALNQRDRIKELFSNWLNNYGAVFIKRTDSMQGKEVFRISQFFDFQNLNLDPNAEYIIEKEVQQHKKLNKINPKCLMTLRVHTLLKGTNVYILGCYLRSGLGDSSIDNASAGGLFVRYDITNNALDRVGYQLWNFGGKSYSNHPNTSFNFRGKPLPYPDRVIKLVKKAASAVPYKELIGWDVAYTEDGPIILEGNNSPSIIGMQINFKGLLNNRYFKELIYEYFSTDGTLIKNTSTPK